MNRSAGHPPPVATDPRPVVPAVRGGLRALRSVRRDIGRKLLSVALAVALWWLLQNYVSGARTFPPHDVVTVTSRSEAELRRSYAPAVYLVVPEDLIVRETSATRVTVSVKGLRTEIDALEMSAIIEINPEELGDLDEKLLDKPLERAAFKARGTEPDLTEFEVHPRRLGIAVARRSQAEVALGAGNVTVLGVPKEGYTFDESKIIVRPNRVVVSGPRTDVELYQAEPQRLKLSPVDVEGRVFEVSAQVGLDRERVDRSVQLRTAGGVVEVTVPIQSQPTTRELLDIPVHYENEEVLATGRPPQRIVSATAALDLKVTGPRPILDGLTSAQLADLIRLSFDWKDARLPIGSEKPRIFWAQQIPKADLKVTDLNGREPEIEYRLEVISTDTQGSPPGESP